MDKHAVRIELFESTLTLLRQGWYISNSGQRKSLPSVEEVMSAATMYREYSLTPLLPFRPKSVSRTMTASSLPSGSLTRGIILPC